jgi:flagellar biosynthesis anti-sigma factor FlgM
MSIDRVQINNRGIDPTLGTPGTTSVRNSETERKSSAADDSIALSSKAKDLDRLAGELDKSRADRLERVRQALEAGTYHISGEDIAKKLIESNTK